MAWTVPRVREPLVRAHKSRQNPYRRSALTPSGPCRRCSTLTARLGFPRAAGAVATCARATDEIKFFSLDLDDSPQASVKVYKVHHDASRADIERELAAARDRVPGAIASFWQAAAPGDGPFRGLPISTYLALTSEDECPTTGAVHFPVRDYWQDDRIIRDRMAAFLEGVDRDVYLRGLQAFAARPLEDEIVPTIGKESSKRGVAARWRKARSSRRTAEKRKCQQMPFSIAIAGIGKVWPCRQVWFTEGLLSDILG